MAIADVQLRYWPTVKAWTPDIEALWGKFAFYVVVVGLICNMLAAYSAGPIPVDWLSRVIFIVGAAMMLFSGTLPKVPAFSSLSLLFIWAIFATIGGLIDNSIQFRMPFLTTPYPVFIALRFMNLLAPLGCAYLIVAASERYSFNKVATLVIWLGTIAAVYAIYVYFAQLYGLPELPRTRMGTGGGHQSTTFTYDFHRAMGSFREPSHLAEWLLAPLFTSFALRNRLFKIHTWVMLLAMLLTGSLAGIAGLGVGIFMSVMLGNPLRAKSWKIIGAFLGVLAVGILGFAAFAAGKNIDLFTLFDVLGGRAGNILFGGGLQTSDRGAILAAALQQPISFFGYGMGRANLILTDIYGRMTFGATPYVVDYHSLYLHYLFATGIVGLILLLIFITTPIYLFWSRRLARIRLQFSYFVGGVIAYAVTNTLLFDELTPNFVVMIAFVIAIARAQERFAILKYGDAVSRPSNG
ncbi:MAG: O-antigen ligase family protein [Rhizomicrobium sp.]